MSRVINDTRDFELLYAHIIPEMITNVVTFSGVLIILLSINWKLALITCCLRNDRRKYRLCETER